MKNFSTWLENKNSDKKALQGEKIETPTFIKENYLQLLLSK